ncbi:hypothetical protein CMI48_03600 [Candidatus Pacearchaeota archaeon]|jgi:hypothetical protein|nr:hypothetical protein [Candidatus Pacearchaeota archaeon]
MAAEQQTDWEDQVVGTVVEVPVKWRGEGSQVDGVKGYVARAWTRGEERLAIIITPGFSGQDTSVADMKMPVARTYEFKTSDQPEGQWIHVRTEGLKSEDWDAYHELIGGKE